MNYILRLKHKELFSKSLFVKKYCCVTMHCRVFYVKDNFYEQNKSKKGFLLNYWVTNCYSGSQSSDWIKKQKNITNTAGTLKT